MINLVDSFAQKDAVLFLDASIFAERGNFWLNKEGKLPSEEIYERDLQRIIDLEELLDKKRTIVTEEVRQELRDYIEALQNGIRFGFFKNRTAKIATCYVERLKNFSRLTLERDPRKRDFVYKDIPHVEKTNSLYENNLDKLKKHSLRLEIKKAEIRCKEIPRTASNADVGIVLTAYFLNKEYNLTSCILQDDLDMRRLAVGLEKDADWSSLDGAGRVAELVYSPSGFQMLFINPNLARN